jgi:epsilon-lactone hydrolase
MANNGLQAIQHFFKENLPDLTGPLDEVRQAVEKMHAKLPVAPNTRFDRGEPNGVSAEWCEPESARMNRVILYLHGGGFQLLSAKAYRPMTSELGRAAKACVLAIDYRLAPENRFPAAIDDGISAYRWLLEQDISPKSIAFAGDSCGGGLVVSVLLSARDAGLPLPAAAVSFSPWADLEVTGETAVTKADVDDMCSMESLRMMASCYLGDASPRLPLASPIYADLSGLPPLMILVGEREALLDDAIRLARRAAADGVRVRLDSWPNMIHIFPLFSGLAPEGRAALADVGQFLEAAFERS